MKVVTFLSYSIFDELHYLKKPWRNLAWILRVFPLSRVSVKHGLRSIFFFEECCFRVRVRVWLRLGLVSTLTLTLTWLVKIARNGNFVPTNGHLAGYCPLTGRYFEPWHFSLSYIIISHWPSNFALDLDEKTVIGAPFSNLHQPSSTINRELKQRRQQWERQKGNRVRLAKQQLCTFITLFVHFVAVVARLQREREHKTTTFFFFFLTLIQSFRIQLQKKLPAFDEWNEME